MPNRKWKGVVDLMDETHAILLELSKAVSEMSGAGRDPIELTSAIQRMKRLIANAVTSNQAAITATARASELK